MMLTSVYQVWTHTRSVTGLEAIGSVSTLSSLLIAVALGITTLGDYLPWGLPPLGLPPLGLPPLELPLLGVLDIPLRVAHHVSIAVRFSVRYELILEHTSTRLSDR
jgi:hypothetical protein